MQGARVICFGCFQLLHGLPQFVKSEHGGVGHEDAQDDRTGHHISKEIGKAVLVKQEGSILLSAKEIIFLLPTIIRSSVIGVFAGILPGAGGSIDSCIAYNKTKRRTKDSEFGKGSIEGAAAPGAAGSQHVEYSFFLPGMTMTRSDYSAFSMDATMLSF